MKKHTDNKASREAVSKILKSMGIVCREEDTEAFKSAEDGKAYNVWKVNTEHQTYVLKKAKGYEAEVYSSFLGGDLVGAPRLISAASVNGEAYILMEYIEGKDMRRCDRESLIKVLDSLIALQNKYWNSTDKANAAFSFEKSLIHRTDRKNYLNDPELERVYQKFLDIYRVLPRTLCHDDLLPFNVLIREQGATVIDWEIAGLLPYPTSLARLIAHCEESEEAFFYMKEVDKRFAIDHYYNNLVSSKGVTYRDFRYALDLFVFYEYCEWIMLGVKYEDADMERYQKYVTKAKEFIKDRAL